MKTIIYIVGFLTLLTIEINTQNDTIDIDKVITDDIVEKSIQGFLNRPIYDKLTANILDSISDNMIEQAIIDNMHTKMNDKMTNEIEILKSPFRRVRCKAKKNTQPENNVIVFDLLLH